MRRFLAACLVAVSLLTLSNAWASFHTFVIDQLYSNGDGSVQFIVLHEVSGFGGQNFLVGHSLQSGGPGGPKTFNFPSNLPSSNTAGKRALIGTAGFAALGIVSPDYVVPNGFLSLSGGSLNYAGVDSINYAALPTDGVNALYRNGSVAPNLATNFDGASASVTAPAPALNYQGIWYAAPAESERGWGINFAHQGDTIFASWFTYDLNGHGWWLVMIAQKIAANTYQGQLLETSGPAFNSGGFTPTPVPSSAVGTGKLTFSDANNGTFSYTVTKSGVMASQVKPITRQVFGTLPTCTFGGPTNPALATNYQDLWWKAPAGSESGWGINLNHESDTIFATWFTYELDGTPLWLVSIAPKTAAGTYSGDLLRTTGPAFNAVPFNPAMVQSTKVGTAKFTFTDGNNATFDYTVQLADMTNAVTQSKAITREVFAAPGTACQ
jgi:hypothetical protein